MEIIGVSGGPFDSNIFLLKEGRDSVLIDSGTGLSHSRVLTRIKRALGSDPLGAVLLTHEHFDHCGGAAPIAADLGCRVASSQECADVVAGPNTMLTGAFLFGSTMDPISDVEVLKGTYRSGGIELEVMPSPGHCPGLVCYLHKGSGSLFCGDLIFCDGGVGRWDLPGGDLEEHKRSISRLKGMRIEGLYPGHGRIETGDPEREVALALMAMRSV